MIDELSWFIGYYEGEGTIISPPSGGSRVRMRLRTTDKDIALRVCKFLEIKKPYKITRIRKDGTKKEYIADHYKDMYEITKTGGCKSGFLFNLYQKMYPHLSLHRREQIDNTYKRAIERFKL